MLSSLSSLVSSASKAFSSRSTLGGTLEALGCTCPIGAVGCAAGAREGGSAAALPYAPTKIKTATGTIALARPYFADKNMIDLR
jgi:hypothetical protein